MVNDLQPARFPIRAAARVIDLVVLAIPTVIAVVAGARSTFGFLLAGLAYHSVFEGMAGTTIGKRLLGLQVIGTPAVPVTFAQAVKRSVAFVVDAFCFGAAAWYFMRDSPDRRRLGDLLARTRVVHRDSLPDALRPPARRVFRALAAAIAVTAAIQAVTVLAAQ